MAAGRRIGLWMKKIGNSAVFDGETGARVPVSLLLLEDTVVVGTKASAVHGYDAVVLGLKRSSGRLSKPQSEALRKLGVQEDYHLFESRVAAVEGVDLGGKVPVNHFVQDQFVDVTGYTIGRGFAGVMKRHNFRGLRASHGVSIAHRSQGSTGQCQDPGRVYKGKKMAGHLGNSKVTIQNLRVMLVDPERSLLVVRGASIPGYAGSYVFVRDAVKGPAVQGKVVTLSEGVVG
ncbi:MAG: 50S ribosomal protein L3 [Aaplasma endosymbiont of Hyalomma asiaticum]